MPPCHAFHIAIEGPPGTSFASFESTNLNEGDPRQITLAHIRQHCDIPKRLFFTVDGISSINETVTLHYYMSLTAEGENILRKKENKRRISTPGTFTFRVKVTEKLVAGSALAAVLYAELAKLKDESNDNKSADISDRLFALLLENPKDGKDAESLPEPSELTEFQWKHVFDNNRALHGYHYDSKTKGLTKAPKQAFRLYRSGTGDPRHVTPPMPPFHVEDDARVVVTEIQDQAERTQIKEGFNSLAIGGSLAGGQIPASVKTSFKKEQQWMSMKHEKTRVESLAVTYMFPRAVIELGPGDLELTEECLTDAVEITTKEAQDKFIEKYGNVFVTQFTLGGYLYSTRGLSTNERSDLEKTKNLTRVAAGLSIQTPWVGGGVDFSRINSTCSEDKESSLIQNLCITWDAHGGNTLLCSNPAAWVMSVKNHRLWRLMDQHRIVRLDSLIYHINPGAWNRIYNLGSNILVNYPRRNSSQRFSDDDREVLLRLLRTNDNPTVRKIREYFNNNQHKHRNDGECGTYAAFQDLYLSQESECVINEEIDSFGDLTVDQKVGLGLYMVQRGVIRWV